MIEIIRERQVHRGVTYHLEFRYPDSPGAGYIFDCDKDGNVDESDLLPEALANYRGCLVGVVNGRPIENKGVTAYPYRYVEPAVARCPECGGEATMARGCGAWVCDDCGNHIGMARCFCGWSASGGDGYAELEEMGECIEEDY